MAVTAVWPILHNGVEYPPGKLLSGLDKDEEKRLVEKGLAVYEDVEDEESDDQGGKQSGAAENDETTATNRTKSSRGKGK
jgi:hypothetical protein